MAQVRNGPVVHASGPFAFVAPAIRGLRRVAAIAVATLLASLLAPPAYAWGNQAHRITALVADSQLSARSRARIFEITGALSLADLVNWPDEFRPGLSLLIPDSERWHYDNRPVCDAALPRAQYCADGHCASAAIARFEATLKNPGATLEQQGTALRFLVHVLGDIHQPLHSGDNADAGGNKLNAALPGESPRNLHSLWDTGLFQPMLRGISEPAYAIGLLEVYQPELAGWRHGDPEDWMAETYALLQHTTYGALPGFQCGVAPPFVTQLPDEYVREAQAQIARQLSRAGVRIAATLNRVFETP